MRRALGSFACIVCLVVTVPTWAHMWAGYAGTYFWIDPKEELVGIMMTQAPGPSRRYYRREIKQLVYQAITDRQPGAVATQ